MSISRRWLVGATATVLLSCVLSPDLAAAEPQHVLKIACLAPEGSDWVKALRAMAQEVHDRTAGAVELKVYPGGVQGDDPVVLRKIRIGQLQGAGFSGQGITTIFPDVLALEVPFMFNDYDEIDYVLEQMDDYYRTGIRAKGYVLLGWSDIGFVHLLSKKPIMRVADISGRKVWRLENEPLTEVLFRKAGVTSIPLTIPDVLLGLQTNMVDVVYAPPAAAIVMQWFTRVKYVTELPINYTLGAFVIAERPFEKLSPAQQELLLQLGRTHMRKVTLATRKANREAMQVMLDNGLDLVKPTPEDVAAFRDLVSQCIPEWVGHAFSRTAYEQVLADLYAYRHHHPATRP